MMGLSAFVIGGRRGGISGARWDQRLERRRSLRTCAWLLLGLMACGGDDAGEQAAAADSAAAAAAAAQTPAGPPPLDSLIAALDSAGGIYTGMTASKMTGWVDSKLNVQHFRAHGHEAIRRLIECLPDQTPTTTTHYEAEGAAYPRGMLCWEVLQYLTDLDASREIGINRNDLYVSREPQDVEDELKRAQAAWRVVYETRAYRLKTL